MVDWVKKTNQRVIQVLPVNDTTMTKTWMDSYPYSSISIYAIHPLYIDLNQVGNLNQPDQMAFYLKKQLELNKEPDLDYEEVIHHKTGYMREYFHQEKNTY